jgi:K+-sensing histidine kinase KdpD
VTLIRILLRSLLGASGAFLPYEVAVMLSAWYGGLEPGLLATALAAVSTAFLFLPSVGPVSISPVGDAVHLALFVAIGGMISAVVDARRRELVERRRAEEASRAQTQALADVIERLLQRLQGLVLAAIVNQLGAGGGALWSYNEETDAFRVVLDCREGQVMEREQAERTSRAQTRALTLVLEQLTREPRVEELPGTVLGAIVEQFEASGGTLWIYDGVARIFERELDHEGGRAILAEDTDHPFPQRSVDTRNIREWERLNAAFLRGECHLATEFSHDPALEPSIRAAYAARGIRTVLVVPMPLQGRLLGVLTLRGTRQEQYGPRDFPLAQALAHHATLAIQMARLAEQARKTAVLEERNRMAREIHDTLEAWPTTGH